jgi:hypothetical protein
MARTADEMAEIGAATRFSAENQPEKRRGEGVAASLKRHLAALDKEGDWTNPIAQRLLQIIFSPVLESSDAKGNTRQQEIEVSNRLAAMKETIDRIEGKAIQKQETTGADGGPIETEAIVNIQIVTDGVELATTEDELPGGENGLNDRPSEFYK